MAGFVPMAACPFGSSATIHWPAAWVCLIHQLSFSGALGAWLYQTQSGLLARAAPSWKRAPLTADKFIMTVVIMLIVPYLILPGLDAVRFRWSPVPRVLQLVSFPGLVAGLAFLARMMRENTYLSRFMEIQPGERVITSGPYRFVSHPLYAAMTIYGACVPLALGSFCGLLPIQRSSRCLL